MTGEITLRGRVLPIGGLKEKVLAAHRGGIKKVLIPKENAKDIREIPKKVRDQLEMVLVDHTDEVLREALRLEDPDAFFRKLPAGALHTDGTSHPPPSPASEATPAA